MLHALPNVLTSFRLAAAPGVAFAFAALQRPEADLAAFVLFAAASATDWLDGRLARGLGAVSAYGRMMDPIADKAMVMIALAALLMLSGPDWTILVPAALIMLREVAVSGLREFLAGRVEAPVTLLAKWKTAAQMVAIGALLLAGWAGGDGSGAGGWLGAAGLALLWIAAGLTVWTGVDYFRRALADPAAQEV